MSAKKFDNGKPRYELLPPRALRHTVDALTVGAKQYGDHNYLEDEGLAYERIFGAIHRHYEAVREYLMFGRGSLIDSDSGVAHVGCLGAEVLMLGELIEQRQNNQAAVPLELHVEDIKSLWGQDYSRFVRYRSAGESWGCGGGLRPHIRDSAFSSGRLCRWCTSELPSEGI